MPHRTLRQIEEKQGEIHKKLIHVVGNSFFGVSALKTCVNFLLFFCMFYPTTFDIFLTDLCIYEHGYYDHLK